MSLDVYLTAARPTEVFSSNITHNLNKMAEAAGIYQHLWRPDEIGVTKAVQLIDPLTEELRLLEADPAKFRLFNAENGWGKYENLVEFVREYRDACAADPDANIGVSR